MTRRHYTQLSNPRSRPTTGNCRRSAFDAAYGNERMSAYLFLPKKAKPPYQTVLYFPGAGAIYTRTPEPADRNWEPTISLSRADGR